jgi:hypothetical protein
MSEHTNPTSTYPTSLGASTADRITLFEHDRPRT